MDLIILAQFMLYKNTDEDLTAARLTFVDTGKHCSASQSTAGRDQASSSHSANSKSLADLAADKSTASTSLLGLQQTDVQQHQDVDRCRFLQDSDLSPTVSCGVEAQGHHLDILVIHHIDYAQADLVSGSSWNDDALSALSVATV